MKIQKEIKTKVTGIKSIPLSGLWAGLTATDIAISAFVFDAPMWIKLQYLTIYLSKILQISKC